MKGKNPNLHMRLSVLLPQLPFCFMLVFFSAPAFGVDSKTDLNRWNNIVVVAELSAGEYLQPPAACMRPGTVCLDPPPFWFAARILSTVYGEPPPAKIRVTTNSHFGMKEYERMEAPQLVLLRTNGIEYVMPRYSREPLIRDKNGKLYLRTFESRTVHWLPCETATLREEIFPINFDEEGLELKKDEFTNYGVMTNPSMYTLTPKGAWARYAISVDRLRTYLEKADHNIELACKSEQ